MYFVGGVLTYLRLESVWNRCGIGVLVEVCLRCVLLIIDFVFRRLLLSLKLDLEMLRKLMQSMNLIVWCLVVIAVFVR